MPVVGQLANPSSQIYDLRMLFVAEERAEDVVNLLQLLVKHHVPGEHSRFPFLQERNKLFSFLLKCVVRNIDFLCHDTPPVDLIKL